MSRDQTPSALPVPCPRLETAVFAHVAVLLLFSGWVYGGNIWWARDALAVWGLVVGVFLTLLALRQGGGHGRAARRQGLALVPWALFGALVLVSCLNPSFRQIRLFGDGLLHDEDATVRWLPSTTIPAVTLHELAFFAGAWLAACNLWLVVNRRRTLRRLLGLGVASAFVLAVFGTLQKYFVPAGGDGSGWFHGFYFGHAAVPQEKFFSTFIYYNHWGAFLALWLAVAAGLLLHQAARAWQRGRLGRSPFTALLVTVLFMAASAPVSGSRSATLLAGGIVLALFGLALWRLATARRRRGRPAWPVVAGLLGALLLVVAAIGWLADAAITKRVRDTREAWQAGVLLESRRELYRDTWTLALRKPVFGWGLGSYGTALQTLPNRSRPLEPRRQYEKSYANAHSDWLQSVAETGFVGTALLVLMGALPLAWLPRGAWRQPLVGWPLFGCGLILLYAWVEFPFANGAVQISFWTIWFAALRLATLHARVTEVEV